MDKEKPLLYGEREAARLLGLSAGTLRLYRSDGRGPAYHQLGKRILYALEDLNAWVSARRVDPQRAA